MMTEREYITLLSALGDVQAAVDAVGLDVQTLMEDLEIESPTHADDDETTQLPVVPEWVSRIAREPRLDETSELPVVQPTEYPPPPRGGNAVGMLMLLSAVMASLFTAVFVLYLIGS